MSEVTADLRLAISDPGAILTRLPNESLTDWIARAVVASHADHEAQIRDLLEEREELLTEIRRLRMGNHPAGRALRGHNPFAADPAAAEASWLALREALTERDAEHEGGGGA